jgi:hypothetical protein
MVVEVFACRPVLVKCLKLALMEGAVTTSLASFRLTPLDCLCRREGAVQKGPNYCQNEGTKINTGYFEHSITMLEKSDMFS